ncbi:outer membrane lipoprotein LolB [Aromatoleum evansii]|uniref:Outer-membrane lipoprotein LolB n=1 Tax=Aromatoleum evansii TaxID=59406 RepID=A0ABZ1AMJ4_AROEV|nr:outer membrane lipoprotein LolB [Aromatoleum evansii]NMG31635.1 outer membrane lipoprotein LolB [Aromatoleum evansii]WRL47082.1 outer membrane lipoprotein LolB [Aromatoleum evansii]
MKRAAPRTAVRAFAATLAALVLAGCASQTARSLAAVPRPVAAAFELEGRLAASDGERAANGSITWSHTPVADEWTVYSPLGQIVGQLVRTPRGAMLLTADGSAEQAADADTILPRLLGVPAPIDGLQHWVQASTRPGARVLSLDEAGRPTRISDAGWIIDYVEYAGPAADAPPRRIDATWGDARIRLLIDQWTPRR